jgi:membrane protein YdbS with pleckstrin-like domain
MDGPSFFIASVCAGCQYFGMTAPIIESRVQVLQWGLLAHVLLIVPVVGALAVPLLVSTYAPLYPARYQSGTALEELTFMTVGGYVIVVWLLYAVRMLQWRRQQVLLFPDRLEFHTGALLYGKRRVIPIDRITSVRSRRALFGFGQYGKVTIRSKRERKTRIPGVRRYRELAEALRGVLAERTPSSLV